MVQVHFVPCLVDLEITHGERVPTSLAISLDSETVTIGLGHQIVKELESKNITLLALCFGFREIDMIKTPDNTLLRRAVGLGPLGIVLSTAGWASVGWGLFMSYMGQH
ncbi:hypothetical protein MJO29_007801 [Puccinia striiformis f. sp. tritici]|nr:hypothetical protein MJO29_007801 [Puccinia striiformis f. sp. tritici]